MSEPKLLSKKQLAEKMGRPPHYVTAMIRCGYTMQYPGRTTYSHALQALKRAPDFIAAHYLQKNWKALPKLLKAPSRQEA